VKKKKEKKSWFAHGPCAPMGGQGGGKNEKKKTGFRKRFFSWFAVPM